MVKNVYIHIPFCKSKCKYCSFISYVDLSTKSAYLEALRHEIKYYYKGEELETLYFGGGTPSLLSCEEFSSLIDCFNVTKSTEITAELNPDTVNQKYLEDLYKTGINRISMGCQTFDDKVLKLIGRRHNSSQVKLAVKSAQNAGFDNINLDFIYGLPTQSTKDFEQDLLKAISLDIQHISLYGLKIDNGCYFYNHLPKDLPDLDMQADMYLKAVEILKDFEHYEISNFGIPSKHNLNYWNNNNYYGFGVGACGYVENTRYSNATSIPKYLNSPLRRDEQIDLTKQEQLEEEIFLGLRKLNGINIDDINKKYEINFEDKYKFILNKYRDYFKLNGRNYSLNINGILISNEIMLEFLE